MCGLVALITIAAIEKAPAGTARRPPIRDG
jgi:hypothetical protein